MIDSRVPWIDTAKALSLVGIIFFHSAMGDERTVFVTGFVIPVFFILYGVTHNNEKHRQNKKQCVINRFKTLMIPYLLLSSALVVVYSFIYPIIDIGLTPSETGFWLLLGTGPLGNLNHLWFLRTMFFVIVSFLLVDNYLHDKSPIYRLTVILISPAFGVFIKNILSVELVPWGIDSVFIALSLVMIGNEIARFRGLSSWNSRPSIDVIIIPLTILIVVWLSSYNGFVNIGECVYGESIYIYMITGVLGTYSLSVLCHYLCQFQIVVNAFSSFNKYGQEIYEIHPLIVQSIIFFDGILVWDIFLIFPGSPLFVFAFVFGVFVPWLFASQIISRSRVLQFMFLGTARKQTNQKKPTQLIEKERKKSETPAAM